METKESTDSFESKAQEAYGRFGPLAARYYYRFRRPGVTSGGTPCMVLLGNHSSGKSSLINWILGGEPVQDVGLAPTDDGFTVIVYGDEKNDVCGPAALALLPEEFSGLKLFGGNFLQHLRVKVRQRELLKTVTIIDSPGMIDAAEGSVSRSYDFEGVVRLFAELCDMVFFLLDPDKPGTTGETVNVFAKCLSGVEFKLRVLLNKCDAFTSMYDFARTYGTVCWNLARVLRTKDLPKIWTIYSGTASETSKGLDLSDFNRHRDEFLGVVRDAAARRRDNVFSQALSDFLGLSIRMCVVNHAARRLLAFRLASFTAGILASSAIGLAVWFVLRKWAETGAALSAVAGALVCGMSLFAAHAACALAMRRRRAALADGIDCVFKAEYRQSIAIGTSDNLQQAWSEVRDETADVVRDAPLRLPLLGEFRRRRMEKAAAELFAAFSARH